MELILYNVSDDERKINKTLENGLTLDVNVRKDVDVYNPFFLLKKTDTFNPSDYNYIQWNNKYYFIRDISYTVKNVYRLETHIDVLMSYKQKIMSSVSHITQNTNINPYFNGGDYNNLVNYNNITYSSNITLPNTYNNIMVTIGKPLTEV